MTAVGARVSTPSIADTMTDMQGHHDHVAIQENTWALTTIVYEAISSNSSRSLQIGT